jgi:hypothetical protein
MSAVLQEVSEGYPTEGRIFEPPTQSRDNETPRYVTILGSLIDRDTATERPWTAGGGIEIANPCLRYVKNFIRKGRITPVLKDTHDYCTVEMWEKSTGKDASYFERPLPPGYQPPTNEYGHVTPVRRMMGKMALPGEQIEAIVNGSANVFKRSRRGVIEHKSLKGQEYNPQPLGNGIVADAEIWKIQTAIFPKWPFMPLLFDDTEQLLENAKVHTLLRPIVDDDLESLYQIRDYARGTVEQTHYTMRETARTSEAGYIPRYTAMDFVLLDQLGMARQDMNIKREVAPENDPELRDMFKQFIQLSLEEKQALADARKAESLAPEINEKTMMAGDPGQPGTSGYSGFSGEVLASTETLQVAGDAAITQGDAVQFDLDGPRPAEIHHKTWEKMRREAGKE